MTIGYEGEGRCGTHVLLNHFDHGGLVDRLAVDQRDDVAHCGQVSPESVSARYHRYKSSDVTKTHVTGHYGN